MQIILVHKIKKTIYEFAKEMNYDTKNVGRPSVRHSSIIKILDSPAIIASGISRTIFLSSNPDELCDRLKLLLQEKMLGNLLSLKYQETKCHQNDKRQFCL